MTDQVRVNANAWIGGRLLRFDAIFCQNRLRITMADSADPAEVDSEGKTKGKTRGKGKARGEADGGASVVPEALGSVVYLDTDRPGLRISASLHVEWAAKHCGAIIAEAERIWSVVVRECDG